MPFGPMPIMSTYLCMNHLPCYLEYLLVRSCGFCDFTQSERLCFSPQFEFTFVMCSRLEGISTGMSEAIFSPFSLIWKSCCLCISITAPPTQSGFVKMSLNFSRGGWLLQKALDRIQFRGGSEIKIGTNGSIFPWHRCSLRSINNQLTPYIFD